jgi:hypothetical protein
MKAHVDPERCAPKDELVGDALNLFRNYIYCSLERRVGLQSNPVSTGAFFSPLRCYFEVDASKRVAQTNQQEPATSNHIICKQRRDLKWRATHHANGVLLSACDA